MKDRADLLSRESNSVNNHIDTVTRLSNLALQLYGWYVEHGHARNVEDEKAIKLFMMENLLPAALKETGFYQRMFVYQSFSWYAFIRQDFIQYYRYTSKWVSLFEEQPLMIRVETGHYIKGLHNLLNAHFDLRNHKKFEVTLSKFERFSQTKRVKENDNFRMQAFIYINTARINQHFMQGSFREGMKIIPGIEKELRSYDLFVDRHRVMVLNYKFAMLCFGSADYNSCIDYLQKIIHDNSSLRYDLQCYARLLHLMAHYELGNDMLMEPLAKSVYRFMSKMKNLTVVEDAIFKFLRQSLYLSPGKLKPLFTELLQTIKHLEKDRFETRAYAYLDIISWVEGKVYGKPMSEVIRSKYLASKRRLSSI
jgi:hypothetical protein